MSEANARLDHMDHSTSLSQHIKAPREQVRSVITVKAVQEGVDYTTRFTLAGRDGGTDLTLTFAAKAESL